jgi:hypothetical protein
MSGGRKTIREIECEDNAIYAMSDGCPTPPRWSRTAKRDSGSTATTCTFSGSDENSTKFILPTRSAWILRKSRRFSLAQPLKHES